MGKKLHVIIVNWNELNYQKWCALHVSCVGTKAHLQPDREYSDTVNLYPWEFQTLSGSHRWTFWNSKAIWNEHTHKVTWMNWKLEKFCASTCARIGKSSTVWCDVVGCKRHIFSWYVTFICVLKIKRHINKIWNVYICLLKIKGHILSLVKHMFVT